MSAFRIGSLFSGYGGLDLAALQLFPGSSVAWHCEWESAPSAILDHHWPGVPNLHDVTAVHWDAVAPVDILTGGYPCQPFSAAGRRKGTTDERHLWPYVREAIRRVRPRYTLLENVAGHRSLGFDRVLGDMAEDGMHVRWTSVRASDVGACHRRERLFILITPADADRDAVRVEPVPLSERSGASEPGRPRADAPHPACFGRSEGWPEPTRLVRRSDAAQRGNGDAADASSGGRSSLHDGPSGAEARRGRERLTGGSAGGATAPVALLPTPNAADGNGGGRFNATGHQSTLPGSVRMLPTPRTTDGNGAGKHGTGGADLRTAITAWGPYEAAIQRQERFSRPAPPPTEANSKGKPRLAAAFAEWMMFLPAGHVTDPAIGLSRNDQLKAIGNGVCPPQAVAAYQSLLQMQAVAA